MKRIAYSAGLALAIVLVVLALVVRDSSRVEWDRVQYGNAWPHGVEVEHPLYIVPPECSSARTWRL